MNYLQHHGVRKQKWGIRRFQYEDGGLTPAGKEHYRKGGKPSTAKRFDTDRYSHEDGQLTYMGNQRFDKSEKFDELRKKRQKSGKNVGHQGISLVTSSVSNSGRSKSDSVIGKIGSSQINNDSVQTYTMSGVDMVSMLFGGPSFA